MDDTRRQKLILALSDALQELMAEDELIVRDIAVSLQTSWNRALAAIMGRDWNPTLMEIARIETALEEDILTFPRNEGLKESEELEEE